MHQSALQFTLEQYITEYLPAWEYLMLRDAPTDFAAEVVWPWFNDIAPVKAEKYGMEAWLTLGVKALVVETNGGFFRWKRMVQIGVEHEDEEYLDTVRDTFGYSIMMGVLQYGVPKDIGWSGTSMFYDRHPAKTAQDFNDQLIGEVWYQGIESMAFWNAFRMSAKMWKEGP
jgi:hypothetical protein